MRHTKILTGLLTVLLPVLLFWGCATVGKDFSSAGVSRIEIGKTTQHDIRQWFGPPWRVGVEDGHDTWTYGLYHYRVFGETETKDLVVRFDDDGKVVSYAYNTTDPDAAP